MKRFKHKKTGNLYRLLAHGVDATEIRRGESVVVYCPDDAENTIYVRAEAEFFDRFEPVDALVIPMPHPAGAR